MTNEDKKLICDYMGWKVDPCWWCEKCKEELEWHHVIFKEACANCGTPVIIKEAHNFDPNDASLCVQEMQKRGEWVYFYDDLLDTYNGLCEDGRVSCGAENFSAWLFNAENFFKAFVEWRVTK